MGSSLCSILVQEGWLKVEALKELLALQVIKGGQIDTILLEKDIIPEDQLISYLCRISSYPPLLPELLLQANPDMATTIPLEISNKLNICPVGIHENILLVLVGEPVDQGALQELVFDINQPICPFAASEIRILQARQKVYGITISPRYWNLIQRLGDPPILHIDEKIADLVLVNAIKPALLSRKTNPSQQLPPLLEEESLTPYLADANEMASGTMLTVTPELQISESEADVSALALPQNEIDTAPVPIYPMDAPSGTAESTAHYPIITEEIPPLPPEDEETMEGSSADLGLPTDMKGLMPVGNEGAPVFAASSKAITDTESTGPIFLRLDSKAYPLPYDEAVLAIGQAGDPEELLLALSRGVHQHLECVQTYVVKGNRLEGHLEINRGHLDREHIRNRKLALAVPSIISRVVKTASLYIGPTPTTDASETVLLAAGISIRSELALIPISIKQKTLCLLIGHSFSKHISPLLRTPLMHLTDEAAQAFAEIILQKKHRKDSSPADNTEEILIAEPASLKESAGNYHINKRKSGPITAPIGKISLLSPTPTPSLDQESVPNQGFPFDTVRSLEGTKSVSYEDQAASLPMELSSADSEENLSITVLQPILAKLESGDANLARQAQLELKRVGSSVIRTLINHFPGQLRFHRHAEHAILPPVYECSAVLHALASIGRPVVFAIAPLFHHKDPDIRFYATYLLSELFYPEAVSLLATRLQDMDHDVRQIAGKTLHQFKQMERYHEVLFDLRADLAHPDARPRKAAAEALAALEDVESIPALISMMKDADFTVAEAACNALVTTTKQDFARNEEKWLAWWEQNAHRHRIEWLIDSLVHKASEIRAAAARELEDITGLNFDYRPDLEREEREAVKRRFVAWWLDIGRVKFGS